MSNKIGLSVDSTDARFLLHSMLERLLETRAVEHQLFDFSPGEGLLRWLENHKGELDLVFLDIEMGEL